MHVHPKKLLCNVCVCVYLFVDILFCSWQAGSVALMLLSMNALGYIELNIVPINR